MVLHCRREIAQRHCFTFLKIEETSENDSMLYTLFCGQIKMESNGIHEEKNDAIWERLAKIYKMKSVKIFCLVFYIGYLGATLNFLLQLPLGKLFIEGFKICTVNWV